MFFTCFFVTQPLIKQKNYRNIPKGKLIFLMTSFSWPPVIYNYGRNLGISTIEWSLCETVGHLFPIHQRAHFVNTAEVRKFHLSIFATTQPIKVNVNILLDTLRGSEMVFYCRHKPLKAYAEGREDDDSQRTGCAGWGEAGVTGLEVAEGMSACCGIAQLCKKHWGKITDDYKCCVCGWCHWCVGHVMDKRNKPTVDRKVVVKTHHQGRYT